MDFEIENSGPLPPLKATPTVIRIKRKLNEEVMPAIVVAFKRRRCQDCISAGGDTADLACGSSAATSSLSALTPSDEAFPGVELKEEVFQLTKSGLAVDDVDSLGVTPDLGFRVIDVDMRAKNEERDFANATRREFLSTLQTFDSSKDESDQDGQTDLSELAAKYVDAVGAFHAEVPQKPHKDNENYVFDFYASPTFNGDASATANADANSRPYVSDDVLNYYDVDIVDVRRFDPISLLFGSDDENSSTRAAASDDEDSNSEGNWRNDYPDEDSDSESRYEFYGDDRTSDDAEDQQAASSVLAGPSRNYADFENGIRKNGFYADLEDCFGGYLEPTAKVRRAQLADCEDSDPDEYAAKHDDVDNFGKLHLRDD